MLEDGETLPEPSNLDDLVVDPDVHEAARVLVPVSITSDRSVRVQITLPEDLVEEIDKVASNRSRFLADAARRALPLPNWYIDDLKETIANYKWMLESLEGGKRLVSRSVGQPDHDQTLARIDSLKRQIAEWQAMVDKRSTP
jgi:hypothetical protein